MATVNRHLALLTLVCVLAGCPSTDTDGLGPSDAGTDADMGGDDFVPLFDPTTPQNEPLTVDDGTALVTRFADRGRDRHAREDFQAYEHYLSWYWEDRTIGVTVTDTIGHGGNEIRFDVVSPHKFDARELRMYFYGRNTVAEYCNNGGLEPTYADGSPMPMPEYLASDPNQTHHYTKVVTGYQHPLSCDSDDLAVGQRIEIEISQFLDQPNNGRDNYYGTTFLYVVGEGLEPWEATGDLADPGCCTLNGVSADSLPIPVERRLGGDTTTHRNESDEPDNLFMQMATNMAPENAQPFMFGRRLVHSSFIDGAHDENPGDNPPLQSVMGLSEPAYVNGSCNRCHIRNGRALPGAEGQPLPQWVFKVGDGAGGPNPDYGRVLQPQGAAGEGAVTLGPWTEANGLRSPTFQYANGAPAYVSARISPPLVGIGLLEAIPEAQIAALADPNDSDGDGISGRIHLVEEVGGPMRVGRFGFKASQPTVRQQVAAALQTDMGTTSPIFPVHDCGPSQADCGGAGTPEVDDTQLDRLTLYMSLLGVQPAAEHTGGGNGTFQSIGCADCHVATFETSAHSPLTELRSQVIHPYTDLLLHDMGPGLADTLIDGDASPQEWRTTPLWGLGKSEGVSGGEAYLHDGRARTIDEAIRWHGGEGDAARGAYEALRTAERDALLDFLGSL